MESAAASDDNICVPFEFEYETQFYDFAPKGFVDAIYNIMLDTTKEILTSCQEEWLKACPGGMSEEELNEAMNNIKDSMVEVFHIPFANFEKFAVENVFSIPPYVCLPEDEIHEDERLKTVNKRELEAAVRDMDKQMVTITFVNTQLKKELQIIGQVQEQQENSKARLKKVVEMGKQFEQKRIKDQEEIDGILKFLKDGKFSQMD